MDHLPDCYEADWQAESLEAVFARKCEAFPHCDQCGGSLYPHDTYTELSNRLYCEKCVTRGTHSVCDLEVS